MKYVKLLLIFIAVIGSFFAAMFLPSYLRKGKVEDAMVADHTDEVAVKFSGYSGVDDIAKILDSPDITIKDLAQISEALSSEFPEKSGLYSERIKALRVLLLCLVSSPHSRRRLDNAITISFDNLSPSQQQMLIPYMNGGERAGEKWESLQSVSSIKEFSIKMSQ